MPTYNKLVRDRIPEIIKENGKRATIRILDDTEYGDQLLKKLSEEVEEYQRDRNIEELADILEVVRVLAELHGRSPGDLERLRAEKAARSGGFEKRVFLLDVREMNEGEGGE